MTFEECVKKYPKYKTFVGGYYTDQTFTAHSFEDVKDIDKWEYAPLDWGSGSLPFIVYIPEKDIFECWTYSYYTVQGYINETNNPNNFYPATYSEDFGWEKVDVNNLGDTVILEPIEVVDEDNEYYERVIQAAHTFDKEAFYNCHIMLTYDDVKHFCSNMEKNKVD